MLNGNLLWERARVLPIGSTLMRGVKELGHAAITRTFLLIVLAPFLAWAGAVMWVHARFPDEVGRIVAAGPDVVLVPWLVMVMLWFAVTCSVCTVRHSVAVALGLLVLFVTAVQLMPPRTARVAHDPAGLPATLPPDEVR